MNVIAQVMNETPPVGENAAMQQDQQGLPSTAIKVQIHDRLARIVISGRFDFQRCRNFRNSYAPLLDNTDVDEILVEMSKVDYLDSSALGMLLLLNERAQVFNKPVTLLITSGFVSQVLEVANFSKIFNIKHVNGMPVVNTPPFTC